MLYYPDAQIPHSSHRTRQTNSYIRVFHASPNTTTMDIYINGNLIIKALTYEEFSQYLALPVGNYNIKAYPSGEQSKAIINTILYIPRDTVFCIAAIGILPNVSLYPIPEPVTAQNLNRPCIRFIHLSPNAPPIDVKLPDGTKVFSSIVYKDITDYACIPSGTYTFNVTFTDTDNSVIIISDINLKPNNYYSIYIVGLVGKTPALQAIPVLEPR